MKKIFTNPVTYLALVVAGIIIYLMMKDGGLKITTTNSGSTVPNAPATTVTATV